MLLGIDCGHPGEPTNGSGIFPNTFVGSIVTYQCDSGFRLVGNMQRKCQESGLWNGEIPICDRI